MFDSATPPSRHRRVTLSLVFLALTVGVLAINVDGGLWSGAEVEALRRVRAEGGEPLFGLVRAPWLDVAIRTITSRWLGEQELGLRLPGLVSVSLTVAIATLMATRHRRLSESVLIGLLALGLPLSIYGGTLAVGRPLGEAALSVAIFAGSRSSHGRRPWWEWMVIALSTVVATACLGIVLGAGLIAITLAAGSTARRASIGWGLVAAASGLVGAIVAARQGHGFVPLLAAAKDPNLTMTPYLRPLASVFDDASAQLFPWLPLAVFAALRPGVHRTEAAWFWLGLITTGTWAHVYGSSPLPLTVPVAVLCVHGFRTLFDEQTPLALRRAGLLFVVVGLLIAGKNAALAPQLFASPLAPYPAETGDTVLHEVGNTLAQLAKWIALFVAGAAAIAHVATRWQTLARLQPVSWAIIVLACVLPIYVGHHEVLPASGRRLSPAAVLSRYADHVQAQRLPTNVGLYRVDDPALSLLVGDHLETTPLSGAANVLRWLADDELRTVLLPEQELAKIYSLRRAREAELIVLDTQHPGLFVVANRSVPGLPDQNPLRSIVQSEPPKLANPTLVRFDDLFEVVGWQIDGSLVRTREVTLTLALHVLKRVPKNLQLTTRLSRGKLSRINPYPHAPTDDVYPPELWRAGDYILARLTFTVPPLEIVSGEHELVVGARTSRHKIYEITRPSKDHPSDHGVTLEGSKARYAVIGRVTIY